MSFNAFLYYPDAHPGNKWNAKVLKNAPGNESNWTGESFPLKKGMGCSTCSSIKALQTALRKRGATSIKKVDGYFGNDTAKALSDLDLPSEVDKDAYNDIVSGKPATSIDKPKKNWADTLGNIFTTAGDLYGKIKKDKDGNVIDDGTGGGGGGADPDRGQSKTWIWVTVGVVVFFLIVIILMVALRKK